MDELLKDPELMGDVLIEEAERKEMLEKLAIQGGRQLMEGSSLSNETVIETIAIADPNTNTLSEEMEAALVEFVERLRQTINLITEVFNG